MPEPIHPPAAPRSRRQVLPGGETIEIDGSTITDPETGQPAPVAILRLPIWRLRELAAALNAWTHTLSLVTDAIHLPAEHDLSHALAATAHTLAAPH
jgi:hypothetical protein